MPIDPAARELAPRPELRTPAHIGVIMDGNGRWARARGKPRTEGHLAGARAFRELVRMCIRYEVKYLTVFSFSSENWTRPRDEVNFILSQLRRFVASDLEELVKNNVKVRVIGDRENLDTSLRGVLDKIETDTVANTGLNLIVAFNYGGKAEIVAATRRIAHQVAAGRISPDEIGEETVAAELYTHGIPDPDLIIRTSGEQRVSNFLLWQAAYSELVFIDEYWPDFNEDVFLRALEDYSCRERRFGGIEARKG
jgi:undecaprenyl diphosphate synthase